VTRLVVMVGVLSGCGPKPPQSAECDRYENCVIALTPWLTRNVHGQYGREGTCWASNQATADACTQVCIEELAKLQATDAGMMAEQCM
jgi:hypothetical protein